MTNPITIQEVLQILLNVRVGYPELAKTLDVDGFIEILSKCEGNEIPFYLWERLLWIMTRFAQFLYHFPIQSELDAEQNEFKENSECDC